MRDEKSAQVDIMPFLRAVSPLSVRCPRCSWHIRSSAHICRSKHSKLAPIVPLEQCAPSECRRLLLYRCKSTPVREYVSVPLIFKYTDPRTLEPYEWSYPSLIVPKSTNIYWTIDPIVLPSSQIRVIPSIPKLQYLEEEFITGVHIKFTITDLPSKTEENNFWNPIFLYSL